MATAREKLIDKLAYEPPRVIDGIINIEQAAPLLNIKVLGQPGPLGNLECLSLERLHAILALLDVQSLLFVRRTCRRGSQVVDSLAEFRDLTKHAPEALAALGKTQLLRCHSAANLHGTLYAHECVSCGKFGPFLFLPTCERCCYICLGMNQSLWVMPLALAKKVFNVRGALLKQLPIMLSIPGSYCVKSDRKCARPIRLVSVKAAKMLALRQGNSEQSLLSRVDSLRRPGASGGEYYDALWLVQAPMVPPRKVLSRPHNGANIPNDRFCGMAAVSYPYLSMSHGIQKGLWCRGCSETHRLYGSKLHWRDVSHLVETNDHHVKEVLHALMFLARSETEFLEHVSHCPGSQLLMPELPEVLRLLAQENPRSGLTA